MTLAKISELVRFSELECISKLSELISQGCVSRFGDRFKITFHGKVYLLELKSRK
jgi:hypothetical protein